MQEGKNITYTVIMRFKYKCLNFDASDNNKSFTFILSSNLILLSFPPNCRRYIEKHGLNKDDDLWLWTNTPEDLFRRDSCLTQKPHKQREEFIALTIERNNIRVHQTCREKTQWETGFFPFLFFSFVNPLCMAIMHVFLLFLSATENNYFGKQFVLRPSDLGTLHIIFYKVQGYRNIWQWAKIHLEVILL